jgi:hypothetical protein
MHRVECAGADIVLLVPRIYTHAHTNSKRKINAAAATTAALHRIIYIAVEEEEEVVILLLILVSAWLTDSQSGVQR